jgi:carbamoyltransferase
MIILGVSRGLHDASATLLIDNNVIFHLEAERLSDDRHDRFAFQVIEKIKDYVSHIDYLVLTGVEKNPKYAYENTFPNNLDPYSCYVLGLGKSFSKHGFQEIDLSDRHHEVHAATAFYNSGFDRALCIVKDGRGSKYYLNGNDFFDGAYGWESGSVFIKEYPNKTKIINKSIRVKFKTSEKRVWINDEVYITNEINEGYIFDKVSKQLGFTIWDAGKTMGLSSYGKKDESLLNIYEDGYVNEKVFNFIDDKDNPKIKNLLPNPNTFEEKANLAYKIQTETQEKIKNDILEYIKKTGEKNICLSGGFFMNCVSNYNLLKYLPEDVNLYIEPMSTDGGNSLGAAKIAYYELTKSKEIKKQTTLYYGPKYNYSKDDLKNEKIQENVTKEDVAKLIANKNIVAIYQGSSEAGHRALGNRSILYDPRDINGKDHVNTIKKREFFRPFAGTVLEEESKKWFNMKQLKDSKFMMYAVDVLENKKELIPAITHVDGTCRIQTLSKNDNPHFYELINEFYKITGVPILFNTSFNLAGHAIVETLDNALWTIHNSEIKYLYLPELSILVIK